MSIVVATGLFILSLLLLVSSFVCREPPKRKGLSSECSRFYLSRRSPDDKLPTACEAPKPISNHNIQDQYGGCGCGYLSSHPATTFGLALDHTCWTDLLLDRSLAGQAMLASGLESLFEEREARLRTCWGQVRHFVAWRATSSSTCFSETLPSSRRSILQPLSTCRLCLLLV